jgi:hypothetical protein
VAVVFFLGGEGGGERGRNAAGAAGVQRGAAARCCCSPCRPAPPGMCASPASPPPAPRQRPTSAPPAAPTWKASGLHLKRQGMSLLNTPDSSASTCSSASPARRSPPARPGQARPCSPGQLGQRAARRQRRGQASYKAPGRGRAGHGTARHVAGHSRPGGRQSAQQAGAPPPPPRLGPHLAPDVGLALQQVPLVHDLGLRVVLVGAHDALLRSKAGGLGVRPGAALAGRRAPGRGRGAWGWLAGSVSRRTW